MAAYSTELVFAAKTFAARPSDANFWKLAELCDKYPRAPQKVLSHEEALALAEPLAKAIVREWIRVEAEAFTPKQPKRKARR